MTPSIAPVHLYRLTAIVSGTLLLVAGMVAVSVMLIVPFFLLFLLALALTWLVWLPAVISSSSAADFHQRGLGAKFSPDGMPGRGLTVEAYSRLRAFRLRRRVASVAGGSKTFDRRLDVAAPVLFTIVWVLLFIFHVTALSAILVGA